VHPVRRGPASMRGGLRDGNRSAPPYQYLSQAVKLMVELNPGPILVHGQCRVRALGARGGPDSHLARGEVEQVRGMVREGRGGIAGGDQAELALVQYDALAIRALILEQDAHLSRPPNAARRGPEPPITIRLDDRPPVLEVLVILRRIEHQ